MLASFGGLAAVGCGLEDASPTTMTGPGAGLKCASSGKNAWETYGRQAFLAVNESIFTLAGAELMKPNATANLGTSLADPTIDFPAFKGKLAAFLVYVYGGPTSIQYTDKKAYDGVQDMAQVHKGMMITAAQYDYFVMNVVVPALTMNGVPMSDISSCFAPPVTDPAFKNTIIGK